MSNNVGMDMNYINKILESIMDRQNSMNPLSLSLYEEIIEGLKDLKDNLKDSSKVNIKELNSIVKAIKEIAQSNLEVKFSKYFESLINLLRDNLAQQIRNKESVDVDRAVAGITNVVASGLEQSTRAESRGDKNALIKGTLDNKKVKSIVDEISGLRKTIDEAVKKLVSFLGEQNDDNNKKRKNFADKFIETLEKSRFVGGALRDLFKVVGFIGASLFAKGGPFGRVIGAAVLGAMVLAAPILTTALIVGFTKVMSKLVAGLVNGVLLRAAFKAGNPLGAFYQNKFGHSVWSRASNGGKAQIIKNLFDPSKYEKTSKAASGASKMSKVASGTSKALSGLSKVTQGLSKATSFLKPVGSALGKFGGPLNVLTSGFEAVDSWKKGRKGNALAFGTGALLSLGAIIAGALAAPIAGPLAVIGGLVSGIALLWKWFKKDKEKDNEENKKEKSWWQNFVDWLKEHWPFGGGGGGGGSNPDPNAPSGSKYKGNQVTSSIADSVTAHKVGKLKVAQDGSILNLNQLTQKEASAELQNYEKSNKKAFDNLYEWVDSSHASLASFKTDTVRFNKKGQKTGALLYKGATKDLDDLRAALVSSLGAKKANALMFTSGKITKDNKLHASGGWKSHNNQYARAFDLAGSGWSQRDYMKAMPIIQAFLKSKGFDANYELNGKFTSPSAGINANAHIDVKQTSNYRPTGAVENLKAVASKPRILAEALIKDGRYGGGESFFRKWLTDSKMSMDEFSKLSEEAQLEVMKKYLQGRGVRIETKDGKTEAYTYKKSSAMSPATKDSKIYLDPTGTDAFGKMVLRVENIVNGAGK